MTATCTRTGAEFPAAFRVTLTASTGSGSCATTSSASADITSLCCLSTTAYARGSGISTPTCLNCPKGWFNTIASSSSSNNYALAAGNCTSFANAGTIPVRCSTTSTTGSGPSTVSFGTAAQTTSGTITRYIYAGCSAPTECDPTTRFGAALTCRTSRVSSCGGLLRSSVQLSCTCTRVRWVVASVANAPATMAVDRVGGACPVL